MKDSDFSGVAYMYDDPMIVPTPGVSYAPDPGMPQLPQASLTPAPQSAGHEMPSPFSTGIQASPGADVMPMSVGYQPPQFVPFNYPPYPIQQRSVGTVEEVQFNVHKHMVGLSILLAGGGAAVGYTQGGPYGALAGSFFGGAVVNAYRAIRFYMDGTQEGSKEAIVSGTYALVAAAAGGFLWYKFVYESKKEFTKNQSEDTKTCDKDLMGDNPCGIRRVGP